MHGRGELQLAILIEEMSRQGFEMCISAPQVLYKTCSDREQKIEPIDEALIDVNANYSSSVIDKLSKRGGEIVKFKQMQDTVWISLVRLLVQIETAQSNSVVRALSAILGSY